MYIRTLIYYFFYNQCVRILSGLIPFKSYRKRFREAFFKETPPYFVKHSLYGKIYMPHYELAFPITCEEPEIYNAQGEKMRTFFVRSYLDAHYPNNDSKYFLWDRFNIALPVHFYKEKAILETMNNNGGGAKYAYFSESESIIPKDYEIFQTHKGIHKDFQAVFTFSEKLLHTLENAKFIPATGFWYGQEQGCDIQLDEKVYQIKDKNISMVCSHKILCQMHKIRHSIAQKALDSKKVDIFGKFNGGKYLPHKADSLQKYRFQIVIENDITAYYFTEKILDCFVAQCIPIYLGASKIDQFFNSDGIITFTPDTPLEEIFKMCNEKEYLNRLEAVLDNYHRALPYKNVNDMLYEEYFTDKPKRFTGVR